MKDCITMGPDVIGHRRVALLAACALLIFPAPIMAADHSYPKLPMGITSFGGAIVGDSLYIYGGHFGEAHKYSNTSQSNKLLRLNLKHPGKWEELSRGPRLQGLALVAYHGQLYRVGGFTAHNDPDQDNDLRSVADFVRFDPETNTWHPLADMPEPRSSHDAVVIGDKLYVAGGWTLGKQGTEWLQTALVADLSQPNPAWKNLPRPPFKRRALSLGELDGKLVVIGGMQQEGGPTTRVALYDPAIRKWSEGPPLIGEGMEGFGSAAFLAGGRLYASTYSGNLQSLQPGGQQWQLATKLQDDRFFHRMLPYHQQLILVGGASMESGRRQELERVELSKLK